MQMRWLQQTGSEGVVVVFGGWAIGPASLSHLKGNSDVLYVDDFRAIVPLPDLSGYALKTLVAFSFGVAAFGHWLAENADVFDRKIAINGSTAPVDRRLGIPPVIFKRTKDGLSQQSYQDFLTLCHGQPQSEAADIDVSARQDELGCVDVRGAAPNVAFDRIWISAQDRIFPPANLKRAFQDQADQIRLLDAPHIPFEHFDSWEAIIR